MKLDEVTQEPHVSTSSTPEEINAACIIASGEPYLSIINDDSFPQELRQAILSAEVDSATEKVGIIRKRHAGIVQLGRELNRRRKHEREIARTRLAHTERAQELVEQSNRRDVMLTNELACLLLKRLGSDIVRRLKSSNPTVYVPAMAEFEAFVERADYRTIVELCDWLTTALQKAMDNRSSIEDTMLSLEYYWEVACDLLPELQQINRELPNPFKGLGTDFINQLDAVWYSPDEFGAWWASAANLSKLWPKLPTLVEQLQARRQELPAGERNKADHVVRRIMANWTNPGILQGEADKAEVLLAKLPKTR